MASPTTVIQVSSASYSLAVQCAQVSKGLHELAAKLKNVEMSILSTAHMLDMIQLAWKRIGSALRSWKKKNEPDHNLLMEVQQSIDQVRLVVLSMAADLEALRLQPLGFRRRSRYLLKDKIHESHQESIRGRVAAMGLLLSVLRLPLALDRAEMLHEEACVFREQDESAHTLVPSGLSSRTPSVISKNYQRSAYGSELLDHPLTIYKRLYKQNLMYFTLGVKGHTRSRQDSTTSISTLNVGEERYNEKESVTTTVPNSLTGKCKKQRHPSSLNFASQKRSWEEEVINLGSEISVGGEYSRSDWAWNSQGLVWTKEKSLHICQISQGVKVVQSTHHYTLRDYVSQCEASLVEELLGLIGNGSRIWRVCLLLEACFQRRLDLVELLLKDTAIVNGVSHIGTHFLYTPLHLAVEMDFPELVRLLCVSGANVDVFSSQGYTLFNLACREDKAKAVEALIPFQNTLHPSYMLGAAEIFNYDTILVLLKSGLDVNARHTIHEETSLHLLVRAALEHRCGCKTAEQCRISPTLQALLDHGAQLSAQDCLGQTVYHYIAQAREPFIKKYSCLEPILAALFSCTEDVLRIKNNAPACQTPLQLVQLSGDYSLRETFRRASHRKFRSPGHGFLTQSLLSHDLYTQHEFGTSLGRQFEANELSIDDLSIDELSIELTP